MARPGPSFRPLAARGRRPVAAILLTFALCSAVSLTLSIRAIQRSQQLYQNPLVNMAYTFMEPLPVGLLIALISAAILRRKAPVQRPAAAAHIPTT